MELAIAKAKEANPNLDLEMAQVSAPLSMTPPPIEQRMVERKRSWKDYAFITVIVAGVSYVIVMVVKVSVMAVRACVRVCVCVWVCICMWVCGCVWVHVWMSRFMRIAIHTYMCKTPVIIKQHLSQAVQH